jgi:hypothetical protein
VFEQTQEEVHEVHKVRELTAVCLLSLPNEWDESRPYLKPDAWERHFAMLNRAAAT